jgi:hypothetical protein
MHAKLSRFCLVLTLICAASRVRAQTAAAAPDSAARAFYAERAEEYAQERRAMAAGGKRVTRVGGELRLRLASGRRVTLTDTLAEGDSHHRLVYEGFQPALDLHVVAVSFYEGGTVLVFQDLTGQEKIIPGLPVASPDGRRFLSASIDLEAGYDPNRLEIWRVDQAGLHCEVALDGAARWGPDSVRWAGPNAVEFTRTTLDARSLQRQGTLTRLVRVHNQWAFASGPTQRLTTRCD